MRRRASRSLRIAALTLVAGLSWTGNAHAQLPPVDPGRVDPVAAGFDVVVLRPLGLVVLAVSAVAFVPVAVVSAPGGRDTFQEVLEVFVTNPAQHVFQRRLGDF